MLAVQAGILSDVGSDFASPAGVDQRQSDDAVSSQCLEITCIRGS
jgi:hypothetical protein